MDKSLTWRKAQRESFTSVRTLADFLLLDEKKRTKLLEDPSFSFLLPKRLAEKMAKNSLECPVVRQFVPLREEERVVDGFMSDPVHDKEFQKTPKMLQKYNGRALIVTTGACAMNCRFCFRQNFNYEVSEKGFEKEIAYAKANTDLHEVILSGGDPLNLSDRALDELLQELSEIPHLKVIRFHTRFPIGIPERITDELLAILKKAKKQIVFVVHSNHIKEWDNEIYLALKKVQMLAIPVLCQTVLLQGVNDRVEDLKELFLALIANGILPYYLHQLDRVQGAAHFEVPEERGHELIALLQRELPGYAIPTYVQELRGRPSKTRL